MTREYMERQIKRLYDDIIVLASMVEEAILASVDALKKRDLDRARSIYYADKQINQKRFDMENQTLTIIATQGPMAKDIRVLASILEIVGELERIGDYAKGIARITVLMGNQPPIKPLIDIPRMAQITSEMLHQAIQAFISGDVDTARVIPLRDDEVDGLYNQIYRELLTYMIQDPTTIDRANYLLWVAHNLERAADRVTNICERTIYVSTGEMVEIKATDDEVDEPIT